MATTKATHRAAWAVSIGMWAFSFPITRALAQLALTALLHCLIRERFFRCASFGSAVRITCEELSLRRFAEDIEASPAFSAQDKSLEALRAQLPESPDLLWDWLRARSVDELLTTLAICVAPTIDGTIHGSRQNSDFDDLARAAELDMRRWWSVTPGFLSRVQKRQILDAVREGVSAAAAVPLEPLKKEALVEAAQRQLDGSGWLPLPLRVG
ncbi:hypothetical protein [Steroidobacter sp.]|uniref:hypothetical protein n=1 Tax=Steroidobacter sp. TaxID=1978227 RepID=UPI001A4CA0FE|nr:hypothetical protein [Steroidobacter sp.]MBL8270821.1 hypothetical protein [Steroidobacter sp.]